MFARTFSLWRRLVNRPEEAAAESGGTAVQEDRRLWVRYRADPHAEVQLNAAGQTERIAAQVRDVSVGGANLVTEQRFHPGQILSLELPGVAGVQVVLACVVRAVPQPGGRWSLGCVFARELAPEDLGKFGARAGRPASDDQRLWKRFECRLKATYTRITDLVARPAAAQVLNISASGIGLLLAEPVEAGSLLNLSLHAEDGRLVRTILACVVHSTVRPGGENAVGCNFIRELSEEELRCLV